VGGWRRLAIRFESIHLTRRRFLPRVEPRFEAAVDATHLGEDLLVLRVRRVP
jgi:hypothetical protein